MTPNEKTFSILCILIEREITFSEAFSRFETKQEAAEVMIREVSSLFSDCYAILMLKNCIVPAWIWRGACF